MPQFSSAREIVIPSFPLFTFMVDTELTLSIKPSNIRPPPAAGLVSEIRCCATKNANTITTTAATVSHTRFLRFMVSHHIR